MIYLLSNGKQQIIAYGNPNLREYSIRARSVERLDMQSNQFKSCPDFFLCTAVKTNNILRVYTIINHSY